MHWLDAGRGERVLDVVRTVAGRLADDRLLDEAVAASARQTSLGELNRWRPASLASGEAGLALAFAVLGRALADESLVAAGHRAMARAVREVRPSAYAGLFLGNPALAAAARALAAGSQHYRGLRAQLADLLSGETAAVLADLATAAAPARYDVVSGLAGRVLNALAEPPTRRDPTIDAHLTALAGLFEPVERGARIVVPARFSPPVISAVAPDGWVDCGLAHGLPGVLAALAIAVSAGASPAGRLGSVVRAAADWLVASRSSVPGEDWQRGVVLDRGRERDTVGLAPVRPSWCYGTPGAARALWLAGTAIDSPGHRRVAVEAITACCGPETYDRLPAPTVCHGLSGLLLIVLHFHADTGQPVFARAAADLVDRILDQFDPTLLLGFRDVETDGTAVDSPGLLSGAAGVALALTAAARGVDQRWTRLFALD